jgi:cyclophilin family peptidyl-prolyl cis-trans isomerase
MKSFFQMLALIGTLSVSNLSAADKPQVELQTNKGVIVLELMPDKAPKSVENFLKYVNEGFYNNTIFHRVIPEYMIQGGGYDDKQVKKDPTQAPIASEATNGLKNTKGTIAVARKAEPDTGTSQFFINMKDNDQLNYVGKTDSKSLGYSVFGKVIKGMDVLEDIQNVETNQDGPFKYFPVDPIIIESATVKEDAKASKKAYTKDKKPDAKLEKEDKKSDKTDKKGKDAAKDDQAAKDAAEDAADAAADKAPPVEKEKKDSKTSSKKVESKAPKKADKKDAVKDDQAAKDAAEDAADAAADKALPVEKEKKDSKTSSKKVEKKTDKKGKDAAKDAGSAPDEPAAE